MYPTYVLQAFSTKYTQWATVAEGNRPHIYDELVTAFRQLVRIAQLDITPDRNQPARGYRVAVQYPGGIGVYDKWTNGKVE